MSKKAYSHAERVEIKKRLVEEGLELFAQEGFRSVRLVDIVQAVGISKPFFYAFYPSMEEYILCVLEAQLNRVFQMARTELEKPGLTWEERLYLLLKKVLHSRENGLFVMTWEEETYVRSKLGEDLFQTFQDKRRSFYQALLKQWGISSAKCSPEMVANLVLSLALVHNVEDGALPFLFPEKQEDAARAQAAMLVNFLGSMRE